MASVFELEESLIEFIAQNTSDFRLKSNEQSDALVAPRVYSGYVPRDEVGAILPGDITVYPAVIISAQSGAGDHHQDVVSVLIVVGCFDDELDQQGYRDCVNVAQRIRDRVREVSIIRERYAWQPPLNWRQLRRGGVGDFPYFFAEIDVSFALEVQMTSQYDVTIGDGETTPGRYNALPIPTPEPNEHWKLPTTPPVKIVEHSIINWVSPGDSESEFPERP